MEKETLIKWLHDYDNTRARSQQTAIGVSQLGGCRRQVWHKLQGDVGTNETSKLAAIMGTAIHSQIEKSLPIDGALVEHRVEVEGYPPATIDYFKDGEVVDWKTIKKSGIPWFVSKQKRWQVQTYAYLLSLTGVEVHTVTLVGIPRDGTEKDIIIHSEPFDPAIALEALKWLEDVKGLTEAPAPERDAVSFCKEYCEFYGSLCGGQGKDLTGEVITDSVKADAAKRYLEINVQIKELEQEQDAAKEELQGVAGVTFDGIKVSWSEVAGRKTADMDAIAKMVGDVPMKQGAPSVRLSVKG